MDHPDGVAAAIADGLGGTSPERFAAGAWSTAYALDVDGESVVLRVGRYGEDFAKDAIIGSVVTDLPVPAVYRRGERDGWAYAVSARATGTPIDDLDAAGFQAVLPALFEVMDRICRLDIGGSGYGLWNPSKAGAYSSWAAAVLDPSEESPRKRGGREALAASSIGIGPYDAGLAVLKRLVVDLPEHRGMIHGDLLARNVLVVGDRISAVLDWGNAIFGDPAYDAAWLLFSRPWYGQWSDVDIEGAIGRRWNPDPVAMRAYQMHMALEGMKGCVLRGRFDDAARCADIVANLARG
jgi:hygromycin-B 4-O-kinase